MQKHKRGGFHLNSQIALKSMKRVNGYKDPSPEAEVFKVVNLCAVDKAPGLDDFTMGFYKNVGKLLKILQCYFHCPDFQEEWC